jgi:CheY-like chemotaxis protein
MDRLLTRESFHLMVLDLMLPGEDGLSICRRLRSHPQPESYNSLALFVLPKVHCNSQCVFSKKPGALTVCRCAQFVARNNTDRINTVSYD